MSIKTTSDWAIALAASAWQSPATEHIEFDSRIATEFAMILDRVNEHHNVQASSVDAYQEKELRLRALDFATNSAELTFTDNGNPKGSSADLIISAAQKYYDFITGAKTTTANSDTIIQLHKTEKATT